MLAHIAAMFIGLSALQAAADTPSIDRVELLWRARGLEAKDKIAKYKKKEKLSAHEECEMELERVFFPFQRDDKLGLSRNPKDTLTVTLYFGSGDSSATVLLGYREKSKSTYAVMFPESNGGWSPLIMPSHPQGSFFVQGPKCSYSFSADDYFHPKIQK